MTTLTRSGGMSTPHRPVGSSQVDPVQVAAAAVEALGLSGGNDDWAVSRQAGSGNESRGARARAQLQWTRHMLLPSIIRHARGR